MADGKSGGLGRAILFKRSMPHNRYSEITMATKVLLQVTEFSD
jgi:hypothetical protein